MLSFLLLLGVGLWIAWPLLIERRDRRRDADRFSETIRTPQALLARIPVLPAAHEALGDALRAAGRLAEAVACYETALELEAQAAARGQPFGAGLTTGAGLENKLRLARQEAAGGGQPGYGQTLATRQQVCRQCGSLNGPRDRACATCGALLPVDHFFDALRGDRMRRDIFREVADALAKLLVVLLALYIASWMSLEVKGVLLIATVAVLAHRFLRRIGGD